MVTKFIVTQRRGLIEGWALDLGAHPHNINKWRQRGVPHKYRHDLRLRAAQSGIELREIDFDPLGGKVEK